MKVRYTLILSYCLLLLACKDSEGEEIIDAIPQIQYPVEINKMFEAHGGLDKWKNQASLSYHFSHQGVKEIHTIDLINRRVLINGNGYDLGFDGLNVWISPDDTNFKGSSPRFYHNLYFYFHCLVFLVADEGLHYEVLGLKVVDENEYLAISITFDEGVGDSPEDEYILYLNPQSYQLEQIMYTVTYYSGERSDNYNGLKYNEWVEKDGLLLPSLIKGYSIHDMSFQNEKYTAQFSEIVLSIESPDNDIFQIPEIAVIDSLSN